MKPLLNTTLLALLLAVGFAGGVRGQDIHENVIHLYCSLDSPTQINTLGILNAFLFNINLEERRYSALSIFTRQSRYYERYYDDLSEIPGRADIDQTRPGWINPNTNESYEVEISYDKYVLTNPLSFEDGSTFIGMRNEINRLDGTYKQTADVGYSPLLFGTCTELSHDEAELRLDRHLSGVQWWIDNAVRRQLF